MNLTKVELTNTCICYWCKDCQVSFENPNYDSECEDCGAETIIFDCHGVCFESGKETFLQAIEDWMKDTKTEAFYIEGSNMGWTHASGNTEVLTDPKQALDALNIRDQWILRLTNEANDLTVVRSSHDELGAAFSFVPVANGGRCDFCSDLSIVKAYPASPEAGDVVWSCDYCAKEDK